MLVKIKNPEHVKIVNLESVAFLNPELVIDKISHLKWKNIETKTKN